MTKPAKPKAASGKSTGTAFLRHMRLRETAPETGYPFDLPAVANLGELAFGAVTILVGPNGSGKSTLIEALAVAAGFNAEGGSKGLQFETMPTHSNLAGQIYLNWIERPEWGWFLRAETFYGMATHIAKDVGPYGVANMFPDLHHRSHGESFLTLIAARFSRRGLYVMDEPESALSFHGQMQLLRVIHEAGKAGSQFVIATHSPLLMAVPGATVYELGAHGIARRPYNDLEIVDLWRRFLNAPDKILDPLLSED